MRPGFEIPEELLEDYYGGDASEAEEEETQTEETKEANIEEEILIKENEESEFFDGSHSTSLAEPTLRDDNSTGLIGEVTLSDQHFKFSTKVKCR